jgi:hypothetical protein
MPYNSSGADIAAALMGAGSAGVDIASELHKEKQSSEILKAQLQNQALLTAIGMKDKEEERKLKREELAVQKMYYQGMLGKNVKVNPEKDLTDEILWGKKTIDPQTGYATTTPGLLSGDIDQLKSDPNSVWKKLNILSSHIPAKYKQYAIDVVRANIGDPMTEEAPTEQKKGGNILSWLGENIDKAERAMPWGLRSDAWNKGKTDNKSGKKQLPGLITGQ